MKIVFASGCAPWPFCRGGTEISIDTLARGLGARRHAVSVIGSLDNYVFTEARSLGAAARVLKDLGIAAAWKTTWDGSVPECTIVTYAVEGVTMTAAERDGHVPDILAERLATERPDVIVTQLSQSDRVCAVATEAGVPVLMLLPSLEMSSTHPDSFVAIEENGPTISYAGPSRFVADSLMRVFGLACAVVPPAMDLEMLRAERNRQKMAAPTVLLVNPQPKKGLRTFLALARSLPDVQFVTVDTWFRSVWPILRCFDGFENITLLPICRHDDGMAEIYARCDILIAPSECDEAFGRVIVEAQSAGLAVVANDRGGVAEAMGDGGVLIGCDGTFRDWLRIVMRLTEDAGYRQSLVAAGQTAALRFTLGATLDRYEALLMRVTQRADEKARVD